MATDPQTYLSLADIEAARERITPHVRRTPVLRSDVLNGASGAKLFFKCENLQEIGAFKARGATNAVFALSEEAASRGVATHSSGNHGSAVALAAKRRGLVAYIVMPQGVAAPQGGAGGAARRSDQLLRAEPGRAGGDDGADHRRDRCDARAPLRQPRW